MKCNEEQVRGYLAGTKYNIDAPRDLAADWLEMHAEIERITPLIHPWYGPCDAFGDKGECSECERLRIAKAERDALRRRLADAEAFRERVTSMVAIYERGDEPEGQLSARTVLRQIANTIGAECSICRRRHGMEVQHACE